MKEQIVSQSTLYRHVCLPMQCGLRQRQSETQLISTVMLHAWGIRNPERDCPCNDPVEFRRDSLAEFPISKCSMLSQLRLSVASAVQLTLRAVSTDLPPGDCDWGLSGNDLVCSTLGHNLVGGSGLVDPGVSAMTGSWADWLITGCSGLASIERRCWTTSSLNASAETSWDAQAAVSCCNRDSFSNKANTSSDEPNDRTGCAIWWWSTCKHQPTNHTYSRLSTNCIIDNATDEWCKRLWVCVHVKERFS